MNADDAEHIRMDVAALQAVRSARFDFDQRVVEASADKSAETLALLKMEPLHQLAEFLFLLRAFDIKSGTDYDALIERHNEYLSRLLQDIDKIKRMGLTRDRVLGALFDGVTRPRVVKVWEDDPGTIDQSSLARFLVTLMSDETVRKAILTSSKAGFLERRNVGSRMTLVKSRGILETIYGECLRSMRLTIEASVRSSTEYSRY